MIPNVDWCVRNAFSISDDDNFGRCILHSVNVPCQTSIQVCNNKKWLFQNGYLYYFN